jgi:hypothetical protein
MILLLGRYSRPAIHTSEATGTMFQRLFLPLSCILVIAGARCDALPRPDHPVTTPPSTSAASAKDAGTHRSGVVLPIDSSEEAIKYAETDRDVKKFKSHCSRLSVKVKSYANFDPNRKLWLVVFYGVGAMDLNFEVRIAPDGRIILKQGGPKR